MSQLPFRENPHNPSAAALAAGLLLTATLCRAQPQPAVLGPESVEDWWRAGQQFVREARRFKANEASARNVMTPKVSASLNARPC